MAEFIPRPRNLFQSALFSTRAWEAREKGIWRAQPADEFTKEQVRKRVLAEHPNAVGMFKLDTNADVERTMQSLDRFAPAATMGKTFDPKRGYVHGQIKEGTLLAPLPKRMSGPNQLSSSEQRLLREEKLKRSMTAGETRQLLEKGNKSIYEANVDVFNTTNSRNEVAYYYEGKGKDKTKFIKIPPTLIQRGLTPEKIQQMANTQGITVKKVLEDLGILKRSVVGASGNF
jgi:hypothetical protein